MNVFCYEAVSGRFVCPDVADADPLEPGRFLFPANSTTERPPVPGIRQWPFWENGRWTLKEEQPSEHAQFMRTLRNQALLASDWTQLRDAPLPEPIIELWAEYRQQLRDLPQSPGWPAVDLPEKPYTAKV